MKHLIKLMTMVLILSGLGIHAHAADQCKVAIVDFQRIQQESINAQKVIEAQKQKLAPLAKQLEQEQAELLKLEEELRNQSMMLSQDAKQDRRHELEKKNRRYKYLENEYYEEAKQARYDVLKIIGNDVQTIVDDVGKKDGYTMILEKNAVGFLYNNDKIDITDQIVKAYDSMK